MMILLQHLCTECPDLTCYNDGVPHPRSGCSRCQCPEGFGGDFCETAGPRSQGKSAMSQDFKHIRDLAIELL